MQALQFSSRAHFQPARARRRQERFRALPGHIDAVVDTEDAPSAQQAQWTRRDVLGSMGAASAVLLSPSASQAAGPSAVAAPAGQAATAAGSGVLSKAAQCIPTGVAALSDPWLNRGLALSNGTRETLAVQGLLPVAVTTLDQEILRVRAALERVRDPLTKYQVLMTLKQQDAHCFYTLLQENVEELLPLVYTPTVGDACLNWGSLLPRPLGLYLSYERDKGRVRRVLDTWPEKQVKIAVVTDGERILGLGDLGAYGMGIPVGKAVVYGSCGVDPRSVLPVSVDVGCNTASVRDDPLYIGSRRPRIAEPEYVAFMDEVIQAIQDRYGSGVIIHWEDVGSRHSFKLLERLRAAGVTTFNDDIECTAAVTVAALLGAEKVPGVHPLSQQRVLFFGAGQANLGCAALLVSAMREAGLSEVEARSRVWLMDSKGLLLTSRTDLPPAKQPWAQDPSLLRLRRGAQVPSDLLSTIGVIQPTTLVGAASKGGAFTQQVVQAMVSSVAPARPVILALSNPTSRAECTFQQVYEWSSGRAVFASGTAFPPVTVDVATGSIVSAATAGRQLVTLRASQCNNCFVFPGIGLGTLAAGATNVTEGMLLAAARAVADFACPVDTRLPGEVLPPVSQLREVTRAVAAAVATAAAVDMVATAPAGGSGPQACRVSLAAAGQRVQSGSVKAGNSGVSGVLACIDDLLFDARASAARTV